MKLLILVRDYGRWMRLQAINYLNSAFSIPLLSNFGASNELMHGRSISAGGIRVVELIVGIIY